MLSSSAAAFNLLAVRFAGANLAFALLAMIACAPWPGWRATVHSAVVVLGEQFTGLKLLGFAVAAAGV